MLFLDPQSASIIEIGAFDAYQVDLYAKDVLGIQEGVVPNIKELLSSIVKKPVHKTKPVCYNFFLHEEEDTILTDSEIGWILNGVLTSLTGDTRTREKHLTIFEEQERVQASHFSIIDYINYGPGVPIQILFTRSMYDDNEELIDSEETYLVW